MTRDWEGHLDRWTAAGLLDADVAGRIRGWESERSRSQGLTWPVRVAVVFGGILLGAGVLLFVSAHWDELSPAGRMSLLVATIALLHGCGAAMAQRFEVLSIVMHTVGSVALGGAIALAGQIFNMNEHWPGAVLLWAIGCALAWLMLRHWTQAALCAILFPWCLAGEWDTRVAFTSSPSMLPVWVGACALSFAYLSARRSAMDSPFRKSLMWLGGIALIPCAAIVAANGSWVRGNLTWSVPGYGLAWILALLIPMLVALLLDARRAVWSVAALAWTLLLALAGSEPHTSILAYAWCAIGAAGLATWGIREGRPERVNLGMAGLAITALVFYFSNVMDKLGRSASLIGVGLLFLGGGWLLERTRRRLLAHMPKEAL